MAFDTEYYLQSLPTNLDTYLKNKKLVFIMSINDSIGHLMLILFY